MISWWWSWLLMAVGVGGLWLAGSGRKSGWAVNLCAQVLWETYALVTGQLGFLVSSVVYGLVYARNFYRWRRQTSEVSAQNDRATPPQHSQVQTDIRGMEGQP